ncbi:hypothetical protein EDD85DRAFT_777988 [Armillaria nabsnona]|nr:hypothetical protein EDD85DRAFT_777988 [Armillaria nabsnona]
MRVKGDSPEEILYVTRFLLSTLYCTQRCFCLTRDIAKEPALGHGHPRKLLAADIAYLLSLAWHNPSKFLDEYQEHLCHYHNITICLATIHRAFEAAGYSIKKITKIAKEKCLYKYASFIQQIAKYPASYLVAMNEVSKDDCTYSQMQARAPWRKHAPVAQPFVRNRRFSICGALTLDDDIIAAKVVEGSFDCEKFILYLCESVVRLLF